MRHSMNSYGLNNPRAFALLSIVDGNGNTLKALKFSVKITVIQIAIYLKKKYEIVIKYEKKIKLYQNL